MVLLDVLLLKPQAHRHVVHNLVLASAVPLACALPTVLLQPSPLQPSRVPCAPASDMEVRVGHALPLSASAALRLTHCLLT
ncbi:unnamed protein product, partial [Closterium sp. Yama58-4]